MTKRLTSAIGPHQTRYCFDPWSFVQIRSNGDVLPCCVHTPVGTLSDTSALEQVLNGERIRTLRDSLLSGHLDSQCVACHNRSVIDVAEFRREHIRKYLLGQMTCMGDGSIDLSAHSELLRFVEFLNVKAGAYGLKDRIYLHPAPGRRRPTVRFKNLTLKAPALLDLYLYLDHAESPAVSFTVKFVPHGRFGFLRSKKYVQSIAGEGRAHFQIPCPILREEFDLVCSISARKYDFAWFHFTYPYFLAMEEKEKNATC